MTSILFAASSITSVEKDTVDSAMQTLRKSFGFVMKFKPSEMLLTSLS